MRVERDARVASIYLIKGPKFDNNYGKWQVLGRKARWLTVSE